MFTSKHFCELAKTMHATKPEEPLAYWQWKLTLRELARLFARHNPRFDADRFMRACGEPV
jgi:hypothetical protein